MKNYLEFNYGATLNDDNVIERNQKNLGIRVKILKNRLRFELAAGGLIFSGGCNEKAIDEFVSKFWFWTKKGDI